MPGQPTKVADWPHHSIERADRPSSLTYFVVSKKARATDINKTAGQMIPRMARASAGLIVLICLSLLLESIKKAEVAA